MGQTTQADDLEPNLSQQAPSRDLAPGSLAQQEEMLELKRMLSSAQEMPSSAQEQAADKEKQLTFNKLYILFGWTGVYSKT